MLLSKQYSKDDIVSFKIANGDELVARYVSDDDTAFVVNRPMTVVPSANGIGLMQSMFSITPDQTLPLNKASVIMHCVTLDQMADHYREVTTGIQTIRKGGIITG